MKNFLCIPIVLLLFSCGGAKQTALTLQEQEVHNVINALIAKQHYIDKQTLVLDELQPIDKYELKDKMYEGITAQQVQELLEAAKATGTFQLQTADIKGRFRWYPSVEHKQMFTKGDYYSGWEPLYEKYKERSYTTITNPIFTSDGTIAVVAIHTKNDWRMGSGGTYLLKKINGKWHCKGKIGGWIS